MTKRSHKKNAVQNKIIGGNQWGYIPGGSVDLVATIDNLILKTHRLTFKELVILQNNAKACFNRIINSHSTLRIRRFCIPNNICKLHSTTLRIIKYQVQTALDTVQCHY